jgi:hypothetical protein
VERLPVAILLSVALAAMAGCEASPIYDANPRSLIGSVPERAKWTATGSMKDAANAVDGNLNTAAVAPDDGRPASLLIDLGRPGLLNMIVIDHGREEFGYARQFVAYTSLDGQRFTRRHAASGTRRVSSLLLISPVLARFIRLEVIVPGDRPWTVAEVHMQ